MDHDAKRAQFRRLHESGTFTMPNPHDVGSCRLLTELGFPALATTSGGFAYSLGRLDMTVGRDALVAHVAALVAATHVPLNVDAENCFPGAAGGIAVTVEQLAEAGAAGCSIEDYDPATTSILDRDEATRRVRDTAAWLERCDRSVSRSPSACAFFSVRKPNFWPGIATLSPESQISDRKRPIGAPPLCSWPVECRKRGP